MGMGAGHARRRSSEDDVFGAAGGLELGSDRSEAATARHAGMNASSSADSLPHVESRGSVASGIGDLPPGEPPSRTLLIRNIQPSISDEALQATFAVSSYSAILKCIRLHAGQVACTSPSTAAGQPSSSAASSSQGIRVSCFQSQHPMCCFQTCTM